MEDEDKQKDVWDKLESGAKSLPTLENSNNFPNSQTNYNCQASSFLKQIQEDKNVHGIINEANNDNILRKKLKRSLTFCSLTGKKERPKIDSTNLSNLITINKRDDYLLGSLGSLAYQGSIRLRKKSTLRDEVDNTFELERAIRDGSVDKVMEILIMEEPEVLSKRGFKVEVSFRLLANANWRKFDVLFLTPFHLAILAKQAEVVQAMMKYVFDSVDPEELVRKILSKKTKVDFTSGTPEEYFEEDANLDGINAIHLAGRYHTQSLLLIVQALHENDFLESMLDVFEAVDPHIGKTPLHFAVKNPNPMSCKILLTCGVNIEAKDNCGYTALHITSKEGLENNCKLLLKHGADPNVYGNGPKYGQTPLHQAATQKVVRLLLNNGADPNAMMLKPPTTEKDEVKQKQFSTCIDIFLERHPEAIEEFLNECISTNGQELDSDGLEIIFNFDLFFKEGLSKFYLKDDQIDDVLNDVDELALHRKIIKANEGSLLEHPIAAAYLYFKWQLLNREIYTYVGFYVFFLLSLIGFVIVQEEMMRCGHLSETNFTNFTFTCGEYGKIEIEDFSDILKVVNAFRAELPIFFAFYALLFAIVVTLQCLSLIENIIYAWLDWRRFLNSTESFVQFLRLIALTGYAIVVLQSPEDLNQPAAWLVVLTSLELFILMGHLPVIGIYIHMSLNVLKTLLLFILLYSPILLAFTTAFYTLRHSQPSFTNYTNALLRVFTMMAGELDLDSYFLWSEPRPGSGDFSIQVLYLMFLIFVSIIIANLMLALTVNQTENLVKKALIIRLKENVYMITEYCLMWDYFKNICMKFGLGNRKLFQYLHCKALAEDSNKNNQLSREQIMQKSWKVCILPHSLDQLKINSKGRKYLKTIAKWSQYSFDSTFDKGYNVYLYDGSCKNKLDITIPAWMVEKILAILVNRKMETDKINATEVENDILISEENSSGHSKFCNNTKVFTPQNVRKELEKVAESLEMPENNIKPIFGENSRQQKFDQNEYFVMKNTIQEIQTKLDKLENVIDCKFKDVEYFLKKFIEETEERKLEKLDNIHKIVLELIQEKNNQTPP